MWGYSSIGTQLLSGFLRWSAIERGIKRQTCFSLGWGRKASLLALLCVKSNMNLRSNTCGFVIHLPRHFPLWRHLTTFLNTVWGWPQVPCFCARCPLFLFCCHFIFSKQVNRWPHFRFYFLCFCCYIYYCHLHSPHVSAGIQLWAPLLANVI